jgi:RHS repeat-associated protein
MESPVNGRPTRRSWVAVMMLCLAFVLVNQEIVQAQTVLFGPKTYTRTAGPPNQFTDTFAKPAGTTAPYTLHVVNGNANGTNRISSATVKLNGLQIAGPSDFGQNVAVIDRTVTLQPNNTLEIRLTSAPGSFIKVSVLDTNTGTQPTALTPNPLNLTSGAAGTLTATLAPTPTAAGTLAMNSANPAVATVPASVSFAAGQTSVPVTVTAVASGSTTVTATLNGASAASQVTVTPPPPTITSFTPTSGTVGTTVTLTGTNYINVQTVTFNGVTAIFTINNATTLTAVVPSGATTGKIPVSDSAGTAQSATNFTVLPSPTVVSLLPATLTLTQGGNGTLTVTISAPQPTDTAVALISSASTIVAVPNTVVVLATQTSAPITVTAVVPGSAQITASLNATSASSTITVVPLVPAITSFTPTNGRAGTTVTLTGANFTNVSAVTFDGIAATSFTVQNATTLTAVVPATATPGPLVVTTPGGTATSAGQFVVIPTQDMQLSVLPATLAIPSSGQASFNVALTGSGGFTNVATLTVTGLPTGMTATFRNATLTAGQRTLLTLVTNGSVPAGTEPLTITATGLVNGVSITRSAPVTVQVQAAGVISLTGQVLDEEDHPIKGALVKLGALQVFTDDGGNFLLLNPPVGVNQLLFIDGGPASMPTKSFPIVPYKVTIMAGQANSLGFVPHLHFQKTTGLTDIANGAVQRIVTDPAIPGLQMTLPAGATITGWGNQPNNQISVRQVPLDRTPIPPLPGDRVGVSAYMDYFGKPGGGTPSEPIPITFPNDLGAPPGTQVELWYYDEAPDGSRPNQMAQYGTGTVSINGSQIVPDIDPATGKQYGQPRFCCGYVMPAWLRALLDFVAGTVGGLATTIEGPTGGDPVDLGTGIFVLKKTDLVLPGRLPVTITRTYRTLGTNLGPFGLGTSHSYDVILRQDGDLRRLLLPGGVRVAFPKQPDGTFRNLTDPAYRGAVLTTSGANHVLRFKDGATWTFGAPSLNLSFLIAQADRTGNQLTFTRTGTTGTLTTITDSVGRTIQFSYLNGRITEILDPLGRRVTYAYDNNSRLATVLDPEGGATRYTYDAQGRMLTLTDARGINYLTNEYDSVGRVSKQTQADGGQWQFAYTTSSGVITQTTVTDPNGKQQTTRFNGRGYSLQQTDGQGQAVQSIRDTATNQVTSSVDSLGRTTQFQYDAAGNVTKITDPALHETRFTYDTVFNRVTTITDALNQITEFTYDPTNGNLLTVKDPLSHVTTITYNAFGQPTSVQGPILTEPPTTFAYDSNGNLITTTDPLGNATQRAYDVVSRLTSLTDPRQLQTLFRYDGLNRVTEIADARQGITRFGYDFNGNLLEVKDAKAQATKYTYDAMDRLFTRNDALNRQESYQYDPASNLSTFTDRKSQPATFQYDALNRRTRADYADGSFTIFTYDAVGRLTRATDSALGAGAIDFFYDNLDRLILEVTPQGAVAYEYDAIGRRTKMTVAGQASVTYQYDAASRLKQVAHASLIVGLGYDNANRRTSLTYPNGTNTSYTYDNASRLTRILHQGPGATTIEDLAYTYDSAGNRTSLSRANGTASLLPAAVASATYDAANEQTAFVGATLTYDANGNLTSDGTNTYVWDARNRLVAMSGGATATFNYDALGRRTSKTINSVVSQFVYDGNDITAEIGGGAVGASYLRSLNVDEPFIRQTSTGNEHYHTDALGSSLALSNVSGASATTYAYEPFGKMTVTGTSSNPFQFTRRENDGTGLYYYRARWYSPTNSRFITEDPLAFESGDINLYSYTSNSPTAYSDPTGELVFVPFLVACAQNIATDALLDKLSGRKLDLLGSALGCVPGLGQANKVLRLAEKVSKKIPGKPFRGQAAPEKAYDHLKKNHGVDPEVASNRLHRLKEQTGMGPTDNVAIGKTGDVYNAQTGERLGSLTDKSLGGTKR